ncbi:MAG: MmcQ/YjbR family DNA-binding protein [Flavobacteriales bacterium]|nr:MmcQ/YjbR family DNA-binding protein [Flavobacteriales bacterium]
MNVEQFRDYCLSKHFVTEDLPFNKTTLVFKVLGKMFALTGLDADDFRINLKCDPERAVILREEHPSIMPGYHMNKQHWNTVIVDGSFSQKLLLELIDHSYELVLKSLPKSVRKELAKQQ